MSCDLFIKAVPDSIINSLVGTLAKLPYAEPTGAPIKLEDAEVFKQGRQIVKPLLREFWDGLSQSTHNLEMRIRQQEALREGKATLPAGVARSSDFELTRSLEFLVESIALELINAHSYSNLKFSLSGGADSALSALWRIRYNQYPLLIKGYVLDSDFEHLVVLREMRLSFSHNHFVHYDRCTIQEMISETEKSQPLTKAKLATLLKESLNSDFRFLVDEADSLKLLDVVTPIENAVVAFAKIIPHGHKFVCYTRDTTDYE